MKRKVSLLMVMMSIVLLFMGSNIFAATDNNIGFDFYIQPYYQNSVEPDDRYRGTTDTQNAWKVALNYSNEPGSTYTITTFWLSTSSDGTAIVTPDVNILENAGAMYIEAYSSANQEWVYLTGENNHYTASTYYVSGIWDEETGRKPNWSE